MKNVLHIICDGDTLLLSYQQTGKNTFGWNRIGWILKAFCVYGPVNLVQKQFNFALTCISKKAHFWKMLDEFFVIAHSERKHSCELCELWGTCKLNNMQDTPYELICDTDYAT